MYRLIVNYIMERAMINQNQLTPAELSFVSSYVLRRGIESRQQERHILNSIKFLTDAGFTDEHFSYEMKWETENGVRQPDLNKIVDVSYESFIGHINIKYKRYDPEYDKVAYSKYPLTHKDDKIQCWCVTGSDRWYTPKKLLEKLIIANERAEAEAKRNNNRYGFLINAVNKYKESYPLAKVTADNKWFNSERIITIDFPSSSRIWIAINSDTHQETIHGYQDTELECLRLDELLNRFNNQ